MNIAKTKGILFIVLSEDVKNTSSAHNA